MRGGFALRARELWLAVQWELVEGVDMLDFLNQQGGLLPEPLAAHLFCQIVDAVR